MSLRVRFIRITRAETWMKQSGITLSAPLRWKQPRWGGSLHRDSTGAVAYADIKCVHQEIASWWRKQ
jgi:hypothetical protein